MGTQTALEKETPARDCLHCKYLIAPTDGDPQMLPESNDYCEYGLTPYINSACPLFHIGSSLPFSMGK